MFILQSNIIVIGNDSDDSFRPGVNEITILTVTPVRVGIGIISGSCWWNLSQNRLELCGVEF